MIVMPTEMEDYLFDLRGYIVLKNAIDPDHVQALNAGLDALKPEDPNWGWKGHLYRRAEGGDQIQQIFEAGEPFERLIDHPSWMDHVRHYVGETDGLFIDEAVAIIREPSGAIRLHSGGHKRRIRTQFRFHNNMFRCGQINVMIALTEFGPGDGATMVIPGSHKSNLLHPAFHLDISKTASLESVEYAIEAHMSAGDALLFVDCLAHGSARRSNPGQRRSILYRYGPNWGHNRGGYEPSKALLARLTPEQKKIIQPISPKLPPGVTTY